MSRRAGRAMRPQGRAYLCLFPLLTRSSRSRMGVTRSCSRHFSGDVGRVSTRWPSQSPRPGDSQGGMAPTKRAEGQLPETLPRAGLGWQPPGDSLEGILPDGSQGPRAGL